MNEIWRVIFVDYLVSNFGRVKSLKRGKEKILKPWLNNGYLYVVLLIDGKRKTFKVHRLVATVFIPNPENKPQVNHINGDKTDNRVENLEWVTGKENMRHAVDTGLNVANRGEKHGRSKLTNEQVKYIRENPDDLSGGELAEKFGVTQATISSIQTGKHFESAGGVVREARKHNYLTAEQKDEILRRYKAGDVTQTELAKEFGHSTATIWKIIHGK